MSENPGGLWLYLKTSALKKLETLLNPSPESGSTDSQNPYQKALEQNIFPDNGLLKLIQLNRFLIADQCSINDMISFFLNVFQHREMTEDFREEFCHLLLFIISKPAISETYALKLVLELPPIQWQFFLSRTSELGPFLPEPFMLWQPLREFAQMRGHSTEELFHQMTEMTSMGHNILFQRHLIYHGGTKPRTLDYEWDTSPVFDAWQDWALNIEEIPLPSFPNLDYFWIPCCVMTLYTHALSSLNDPKKALELTNTFQKARKLDPLEPNDIAHVIRAFQYMGEQEQPSG